ncbi:MAG: Ig-like domain-containing protein [Treponema sp.]|jgi:hypothetical protein|nr:Ig-like domain-containing protein [Treponema sp.]
MSRLLNNFPLVMLCVLAFASCDAVDFGFFADFSRIEAAIEPGESGAVLPEAYSPVTISFNTEVERNGVENIFNIYSETGIVRGDRSWENNVLSFTPSAGWSAGIQYTINFSGMIRALDGRELMAEKFIIFYAINDSSPPVLEYFSPENFSSTGINDVVPEFHFSCPMDRITVESALTISGFGNKTFDWSDDKKILRVIPEKTLTYLASYQWILSENAKSAEGVSLLKDYTGYFTANMELTPPQVDAVYPAIYSNGVWFPTGADIETGLGPEQDIIISFSREMDDNMLRSLRFEPSLTGRTERLDEKRIVYRITKSPEPETRYTLIVSGDAKDRDGIKMDCDYTVNFTPDIPYLNILSFNAGSGAVTEDFRGSGNLFRVYPAPVTGGINMIIRFSFQINDEEKQNTALKISLNVFFPGTLPSAALYDVRWISNDRLQLYWEGLKTGNSGEPYYYKLTIPGGKNGITGGGGLYMKEDIIIFLEAAQ